MSDKESDIIERMKRVDEQISKIPAGGAVCDVDGAVDGWLWSLTSMHDIAEWARGDTKAELQPVIDSLRDALVKISETPVERIHPMSARVHKWRQIAEEALCNEQAEASLAESLGLLMTIDAIKELLPEDECLNELMATTTCYRLINRLIKLRDIVYAKQAEEPEPVPKPKPDSLKDLRKRKKLTVKAVEAAEKKCWPNVTAMYNQWEQGIGGVPTDATGWLAGLFGRSALEIKKANTQSVAECAEREAQSCE